MTSNFDPPASVVRQAAQQALREDMGERGDVTSALLPKETHARAQIVARQGGVLAGTACVAEVFLQVDSELAVSWLATDGDTIEQAQTLGEVSGRLASICTAERTALNFLCHLSGVATYTHSFVAAGGGEIAVFDTRKTTPLLRSLEKSAVRAGGGNNHRSGLSDWVMLKDNHQSVLGIEQAVRQARQKWPSLRVQVECDTEADALQAAGAGADALLLDNMKPEEVASVLAALHKSGLEDCYVEASGGITAQNVAGYAGLGLDAVSTGSLTAKAQALDIALDVAF